MDRPILMSAPMVRAILDGKKRQTRRVVKMPHDVFVWTVSRPPRSGVFLEFEELTGRERRRYEPLCPYGAPSDRLWAKETVIHYGNHFHMSKGYALLRYVADGAEAEVPMINPPTPKLGKNGRAVKTPAIFMRREWSRITLAIESVRVERLHDISEEDARAEGAPYYVNGHGPVSESERNCDGGYHGMGSWRGGFEDLWRNINGAENWQANPFVWVINFSRMESPNV